MFQFFKSAAVFIHGNERYKPEYWPNDVDECIKNLEARNCRVDLIKDLKRKFLDETHRPLGETIAKLVVATKMQAL